MAKESRMVKIDKEQISGIKLFRTMTLARRKQWLWRPPEMGISRTGLASIVYRPQLLLRKMFSLTHSSLRWYLPDISPLIIWLIRR